MSESTLPRIRKFVWDDNGQPIQKIWDTSSLSSFLACPRYYKLSVLEGWKSTQYASATGFGSAVHAGLEELDKARHEGANKQTATNRAVALVLKDYGEDLKLADDNARGLESALRAVVWKAEEFWDDNLKLATMPDGSPALEQRFEVPIGDKGHRFSGRIDKIVSVDDRLYLVDTKTTKSSLSEYYFNGYMPNNQVFAYIWACREVLKLPVDGFIIDAVQTGSNFCRFARQVYNVSKELVDEWYADTLHHLEISDVYANSQYYPANFTSCGNYGGCRYREACAHAKSQRNIFFGNDFQQEYHPDLEETKPMKLEVIEGGKQ